MEVTDLENASTWLASSLNQFIFVLSVNFLTIESFTCNAPTNFNPAHLKDIKALAVRTQDIKH